MAPKGEAALPQEHPVAGADESASYRVVVPEEVREAVAAEHEGVAADEEGDEPQAEDGKVRRHHMGGVLGPAEAGFDKSEAGLHEDDQHSADHDPQQVQPDLAMRKFVDALLGEVRARGVRPRGRRPSEERRCR
jgi:hypothetical protein